jgi:hypothetical protein
MAQKLLIDPLDLSQFSDKPAATNPGFADLINSELGNQATDGDGYDADVIETLDLIGFFDVLTGVNNTELDAILALLNTSDPAPIGGGLDAFGGAQPTGQGFLDGVDNIATPSLTPLSLLQPSGGATVVLGGPPSTGGVAKPGSPPYTYHLQLFTVRAGIDNVDADGGNGPNPPFASFGPVVKETAADGKLWWVYLIQINPQTPGTYTAQAQYLTHGTFFGVTGTIRSTRVFQVVIQ